MDDAEFARLHAYFAVYVSYSRRFVARLTIAIQYTRTYIEHNYRYDVILLEELLFSRLVSPPGVSAVSVNISSS